ncbi:damage-inducible protein CinA [Bacillaceae bacterium JMAK1]|nr:damage-inducible protein CinA [Bacillaceae bacterium JMAK1]
MNAEIIAVGTELLLGQIANTNGQHISSRLANHGVNVYKHTVVGDNKKRIQQAIIEARKHHDLIIFTGGLGPTEDDLTREALSELIQVPLIYDEAALEHVEQFFSSSGRTVSEANKKQALTFEGAHVFHNHAGLACGSALEHEGILYCLLPGPPREMRTMVERELEPYLATMDTSGNFFESRVLRFYGIGESSLEAKLQDIISSQNNPTIAPLAGEDEVTLRLTVTETNTTRAKALLDETEREIYARVGKYLYGFDNDSLYSKALEELARTKSTIATAESITGGGLASSMTSVKGASQVVLGGFVTYSNDAKVTQLGVRQATIDTYGAVSEQCAKEMAEGVRDRYGSTTGISLTGVAGPDELEGHPVGTLFIGVADGNKTVVFKRVLSGTRETIRRRAAKEACHVLLLQKKKGD